MTDKSNTFASLDDEIDAVERTNGAELFLDAFQIDNGHETISTITSCWL